MNYCDDKMTDARIVGNDSKGVKPDMNEISRDIRLGG
jgi:hypothetical protein